MMRVFFSILIIAFSSVIHAQIPDWQWAKRGGGNGTWNPSSSSADDIPAGVVTDRFGNTTVCGRLFNSSTNNIDGQPVDKYGQIDGFIAQFDCDGDLKWKFSFGGPDHDLATGITNDSLGNVYVTGYISAGSKTWDSAHFADSIFRFKGSQAFVSKLDTSGKLIWLHVAYSNNTSTTIGTNSRGVAIDCNNQTVNMMSVCQGNYNEYAPGININNGVIVARYLLDGKVLNTFKVFDYSSKLDLRKIAIDEIGNSFVVGTISDSIDIGGTPYAPVATIGEAIVIKFDSVGNHTWGTMSETAGNPSLAVGHGIGLIPNKPNSFYLVGTALEGAKFGNLTVTNTYNGGTGYLVKYYYGSPDWIRNVKNTSAYNDLYNISLDKSENVFVAGTILGSGTFAGDTVVSKDLQDIYFAKFDKFGNGKYAKTTVSSGFYQNLPFGIAAGYNGNVFLTGSFESKIELPSGTINSHGGNTDFFIAKYGINECEDTTMTPIDTGDAIAEFFGSDHNSLHVFPNPNNGRFTLELERLSQGELKIYNTLGSVVYHKTISNQLSVEINLPGSLSDGVYLVQLLSENRRASQRVIVRRE